MSNNTSILQYMYTITSIYVQLGLSISIQFDVLSGHWVAMWHILQETKRISTMYEVRNVEDTCLEGT